MNLVSIIGLALIFVLTIAVLAKLGLLNSTRNIVLCTALAIAAILLRLYCFDWITDDYRNFLAPWIQFFESNGGFYALQYSLNVLLLIAKLARVAISKAVE